MDAFFPESTGSYGCTPQVAASIGVFTSRWGPYTTKSRRYSLHALFGEVIGPAWSAYVSTLPSSFVGRKFSAGLDLSTAAREFGFSELRRRLEKIVLAMDEDQRGDKGKATIKWKSPSKASQQKAQKSRGFVFTRTLESLIGLSVACSSKGPKFNTTVANINALRRHRVYCDFCGQKTEVQLYLDADPVFRETNWQHENGDLVASLSSKYCIKHRPQNHDGSWNSEYQRAKRTRDKFELEAQRLTHQSKSTSKRLASSGNAVVDDFYIAVINQKLLYPDEKAELRDHASRLVQHKVSDIKKFMVTLRAAGFTQAEISLRCGVSQQSVSKALKSLPATYRLGV